MLNENSSWNQTNLTNCKYYTSPKTFSFYTSPKRHKNSHAFPSWSVTYEQATFSQSSTAARISVSFEVWQPVFMFLTVNLERVLVETILFVLCFTATFCVWLVKLVPLLQSIRYDQIEWCLPRRCFSALGTCNMNLLRVVLGSLRYLRLLLLVIVITFVLLIWF